MAGGTAAAQVIVVHGGQVVVHQAVDMNEFDRRRRRVEQFQWRAERFAGGVHQHGPYAFAAGQCAVAHGLEQPRRRAAIDFQRARQHGLDALLVLRNPRPGNSAARGAQLQRPASSSSSSSSREWLDRFLAVARQQHFHFLLRGAQRGLALARERNAAFESLERLLERHVALFEFRHERFEFGRATVRSQEVSVLISRARR